MSFAFAETLLTFANATTSQTGSVVSVSDFDGRECVGELYANADSAGTLDVVIYHAPHATAAFKALFTFTQVTSETAHTVRIHSDESNTVIGPCFRAIATIGSGTYDATVKVYFGSK